MHVFNMFNIDEYYMLARYFQEYDGLFIEGSAKSGDNIMEAVVELTR